MKTALDFAEETMKIYARNSIYNPANSKSSSTRVDVEEVWEKKYKEQQLITYLQTILERMPYERYDNETIKTKHEPTIQAIRETTERTIAKCFDDMIKESK